MTSEGKKVELTYWKNQEKAKEGEKYTDNLFPPNESSLGSSIDSSKVEWLRASEIYKEDRYVLISDKMDMNDIVPGQLDDAYFLSSVQNLCKVPANINRLFKTKIMNPDGYYELILNIDGKPQIVIVDDYFPVDKSTKKIIYANSKKNEIWVCLLEKAWAKINGSYSNIIGGYPSEALEFLTGFSSLSYDTEGKDEADLNEYKIEIVKQLELADKKTSIISCSTSSKADVSSVGLIKGYTYNMLNFYHIEKSDGNKVYLFQLRNPWSKGEWTGDWSDKSSLWDDKAKGQVSFSDKVDGIFYMNDTDFFKYFTHVEICYVLYDATIASYTLEGDEKNKNGIVFNIETEKEGSISISVLRKNWRTNREIKDKMLATHISLVKYDPNAASRLKTFTDYTGNFESYKTCALTANIEKGNYLIYVYRDVDHAEFTPDDKLDIKIICSSNFKHAQMSYDEREKGFPLLQNIILQAEFIENNYDPDKSEDFDINSNQIRGNGIGHVIYYISTPGYFLNFTGSTKKVKNYIMLTPYLSGSTTTFTRAISSGKYLVFLGLLTKTSEAYAFSCFSKAYTTNREIKENYENNDIDLKLYTDIKNNIKNDKVNEIKTKALDEAQNERYYDVGNEKTTEKTLDEIKKEYGEYYPYLDRVPGDENDPNLKWVVIQGEYVIYVGQVNKDGIRQGKGILINPKNVFAGEFKNDLPNGKGYMYNANKEKLFYAMFVNGIRKGDKVTPEEEAKEIEEEERKRQEELEKEKERLRKEEEARQAELKRQEEERRKEEERIAEEKRKAEEAIKAEEARIQAELKRQEEEAKRREEELRKQEEERQAELKRQAEEEAKRLAEEKKKQEEAIKAEQERLKAELEKLAQQQEEEAKKKAEELKKKEEELRQQAEKQKEEAKKAEEKAKQEAEQKLKEAQEQAQKLIDEAKKKAEKEKEEAEKQLKKAQEEAKKREEEIKKQEEKLKEEAKKKEEEAKKAEEKAKQEAQKVQNDIANVKEKIKAAAEERKKQQSTVVVNNNTNNNNDDTTSTRRTKKRTTPANDYADETSNKRSSKRSQGIVIPLDVALMEICVTCGCNIF